jgi:hypothetical protein
MKTFTRVLMIAGRQFFQTDAWACGFHDICSSPEQIRRSAVSHCIGAKQNAAMISQNDSGGCGKSKVICGDARPVLRRLNPHPSKIEG